MSPAASRIATGFGNRELSWLAFDERVLEEAADPTTPLLERAKFAAIAAANLDEFFMVRVAGLHQEVADGRMAPDPSGLSPARQLEAISERAHALSSLCTIDADELLPRSRTQAFGRRVDESIRVRARRSRVLATSWFRSHAVRDRYVAALSHPGLAESYAAVRLHPVPGHDERGSRLCRCQAVRLGSSRSLAARPARLFCLKS